MTHSIVEYYAEHEKYKCGYCKRLDTNYSHGLWAYSLKVQDYQDLIDRGWRRSGMYCYKPTMEVTCCPMYTIRCEALNFKLSKSQKKVIKRFNKFLCGENMKNERERSMSTSDDGAGDETGNECFVETKQKQKDVDLDNITHQNKGKSRATDTLNKVEGKFKTMQNPGEPAQCKSSDKDVHISGNINIEKSSGDAESSSKKPVKQGMGLNPDKGPCKKAKLLRLERKTEKLKAKGADPATVFQKEPKNQEKSLEDLLEDMPEHAKKRLEVRLVRTTPHSAEWKASASKSHDVYVKYQTTIHKDKWGSCNEHQYNQFLVTSPLLEEFGPDAPPCGYGSFQQQYWLDGRLVAVGVIDILPNCTSSVYFFYDPNFKHLSFGTYGALREIALTRQLNTVSPQLKYYYMGYYIQSCRKMRYKGNFKPSQLLCPETYQWFSLEEAVEKLEKNPYSRLNSNIDAIDENGSTERDLEHVPVLYKKTVLPYLLYKSRYGNGDQSDEEDLLYYTKLVGRKLAKTLILVK